MTVFISGWQWTAAITNMQVMKATVAKPSPWAAGDNGLRPNSRGWTWEPFILKGIRTRMASMRTRIRRKKHSKPMMDQRRMRMTEGIVGLTWEPEISTGMSVSMAMMWMWMRRIKYRKPRMEQRRMWRTEGIVLESVKIGQCISDQ
jgi:hypothetical protein